MRFICTELGGEAIDLFEIAREDADSVSVDGVELNQAMAITQNKQGIDRYAYYFGGTMNATAGRFALDGTARTLADIETALAVDVDLNFTDTAEYYTNFHRLSEIQTNLWFTVLTDDGVAFYLPKRKSSSAQCQNYVVLARTDRTGIFESANYAGESGAEIYLALNECGGFIPTTIDDTQKARVVNKFYSLNSRLTIQTTEDLNPLDYVIEDGEAYVVLSRKRVEGGYQYECVLEADAQRSFSGANVTGHDSVRASHADKATSANSADSATLWNGFAVARLSASIPVGVSTTNINLPSGWTAAGTSVIGASLYFSSLSAWVDLYGSNTLSRRSVDMEIRLNTSTNQVNVVNYNTGSAYTIKLLVAYKA